MNRKRVLLCLCACLVLCILAGCGGFWKQYRRVGEVKCNDGTQLADADARQAERFCRGRGGVDESSWTNMKDY
jgi:hypothetical protein